MDVDCEFRGVPLKVGVDTDKACSEGADCDCANIAVYYKASEIVHCASFLRYGDVK